MPQLSIQYCRRSKAEKPNELLWLPHCSNHPIVANLYYFQVEESTYSVIILEPIASQNCIIPSRRGEWYRNPRSAIDLYAAKSTSSLVESKGREVIVAANLILHLQHISEVPPRGDWTVGSINSILPWIPPLLDAIPAHESAPNMREC